MLHIESFSFNPFSENTLVIYNDNKEAFIIDPGNFSTSENAVIGHFIEEKQLQVQKIILTHAHIDHVLGLYWATKTFETSVTLHKEENEILSMAHLSAQKYGIPFNPVEPKLEIIEEGEIINLGKEVFKVLFLPGHSPGHIGLYNEKSEVLISGDVIFQGSIGRTDLYKGNHQALIASIKNKVFTLPDSVKIYPGHGPTTTVGYEKQYNPFF